MFNDIYVSAYAKSEKNFNYWYQRVCLKDECKAWLDNIPLDKWACLYDGGLRYGHMTTNLAECINSVLKGTRNLPITSLIRSTFHRLAMLFAVKGCDALTQRAAGHIYSEMVMKSITKNINAAKSIKIREYSHDRRVFEAVELAAPEDGGIAGDYKVDLNRRTCDCGEFQAFRYPCRHVIAGCAHYHVQYEPYIDDVYLLDTISKVYGLEFNPIGHESTWPQYNGDCLCPDPALRRPKKGRPKSTRIRNEMDLREKGQPKRCGICRTVGHSRNNCPNR